MATTDVQQIDAYGALLTIRRTTSSHGPITSELTVECPEGHPTGVTTTMLQGITAALLRGLNEATPTLDQFVMSRPATLHWTPGARNTTTDKLLRDIADTYAAALQAQQNPTQAVSRWLHSSVPTAQTLIRRARDKGFLHESPRPGRPPKPKPRG